MFGKGVYFADMVSKSANYCHTDQTGLLLLCEVALGNMLVSFEIEAVVVVFTCVCFKGFGQTTLQYIMLV